MGDELVGVFRYDIVELIRGVNGDMIGDENRDVIGDVI